ncbi:MAG TPA: ADOP family duplicated permease, partial [Vicinamibacteria bacterium]|nr:ADOP family duplicated permease [Vicinamibacteria bacterium]
PVAGRLLGKEDAQRSAIVGTGFAQRNYGSAQAALGRAVFIETRSYEIVGVAPEAMRFPPRTEVWAAAALEPENRNRSGHNYKTVARLLPGVSVEAANAELETLSARLAQAFPDSNAHKGLVAVPLRENLVSRSRATLAVMMGAVALVLLIACANVANLMLARTAAREREVAVRQALGAGRRHLLVQLLAESLLLSAAAGVVGLLLARALTSGLLRVGARYAPLPRLEDVHLDWRVLLFTAVASLVTAVGFGLAPALQAARVDLNGALNQSGRGTLGASGRRLRGALVVVQVALSFTLAIDAGLLLRSFLSLTREPLGFRTEGVLVAYAHAPARRSQYDTSGIDSYLRAGRFFDELFARLGALPGVVSASGAMGLPTGQYDSDGSYAVLGRHTFGGDFLKLPHAGFRLAAPGYFATLAIPLRRGREFEEGDVYERPFVAVVSESLARQSFPDVDPIGQRIMCGFDQPDKWMTVVGVVGDVRQDSPASSPVPQLYMPLRQHPYAANEVQVVVRTSVRPQTLVGAVREAVRSMDPEVATKFTTLEASVADSVAAPRFRTTLASAFASLALLLAFAGTYAVMSYLTAQRTAEFGLRLAIGARGVDVVTLVLRGALPLLAAGAGLGLLLALASATAMRSLLYGVPAVDLMTYGAVLVTALPLVALAAALPAVRAVRLGPMLALREL